MEYFEFLIQMDEINREIDAQPLMDRCDMSQIERAEAFSNLRAIEEKQYVVLANYGIHVRDDDKVPG